MEILFYYARLHVVLTAEGKSLVRGTIHRAYK